MSTEISIKSREFSSSTLRKVKKEIQAAIEDASCNVSGAGYLQAGVYHSLYTSGIASQLRTVVSQLENVQSKLEKYSAILDSAQEDFSYIDNSAKNQVSDWWSRTKYSATETFADKGLYKYLMLGGPGLAYMTGKYVKDSVGYWVDNYKNKDYPLTKLKR